ncbi:hypothetical protein [Streptomyces sp. NPDC003327]
MDDMDQYVEDPWDDFDDEQYEPPQPTYREAVERLKKLASRRGDVRVEWDDTQKWDGRRWRNPALVVFGADDLRIRLRSAAQLPHFERLVDSAVPMPTRQAVWFPQDRVIMARLLGDFDEFHHLIMRRLFPRQKGRVRLENLADGARSDLFGWLASEGAFPVSASDGSGFALSLVSVPRDLSLLYSTGHRRGLAPSLKFSGVTASDAEEAQEKLVAYGTSYLFGLARAGASLRLWNDGYRLGSRRGPSYSARVRFPQKRYDSEPAELYGAGNSLGRHPVERFLKYYQVLEFYMPKATAHEVSAQQVAKESEASSPFPRQNSSMRLEQSQLDAVINLAVTQKEIVNFLGDKDLFSTLSDPLIIQHVTALDHDGSGALLPSQDYRTDVSSRVYGIRNRIVHMKEGGGRRKTPLLGIHSREARDLASDLRMVRYLAEKAMEHWATALP